MDPVLVLSLVGRFALLIALGVMLGLVLSWLWRRYEHHRQRTDPEFNRLRPLCRRCDYALRQLTSSHCPECGADLHQPGAVAGKPRRARCIDRVCMYGTTLLVCSLLWWMVCNELVALRSYSFNYIMARPASGAYEAIRLTAQPDRVLHRFAEPWRDMDTIGVRYVSVSIDAGGNWTQHQVYPGDDIRRSLVNHLGAHRVASFDEFSADTLADWLRQLGVDVDDPAVVRGVADGAAVVNSLIASREPDTAVAEATFGRVTKRYSSSSVSGARPSIRRDHRAALVYITSFVVMLMLLVAGLASYEWRNRRDIRRRLITDDPPLDLDHMCLAPKPATEAADPQMHTDEHG